MKTKQEIKRWLLENCVNDKGDLDLGELDFSDFEGNVRIYYMKVKNNLYQYCQAVGGDLFQDYQKVGGGLWQRKQKVQGDLYQDGQVVSGDLYQECQSVEGDLLSHELENDEEWEEESFYVLRAKALKEITLDELATMGYKIKEHKQ